MEVRATKVGFYEALRQPGDVFHVPDGMHASWFVSTTTFVAIPPTPVIPAVEDDNLGVELGYLEITGSGEDGKPVFKPYPENTTPENQTVSPETGRGKRK